MKMYGWTADKDIIKVDLPPHEVVEQHIDPFRIDLFEPNPVERTIDGQLAFFTRLKPLSFAHSNARHLVLGYYDGKHSICLSGAKHFWTNHTDGTSHAMLVLRDSKREDFDEHLAFHLAMRSEPLPCPAWERAKNFAGAGPTILHGIHSNTPLIKDGRLRLDDTPTTRLNSHEFAGKMYEPVRFTHLLPASVNWLAGTFTDCLIIGDVLRDVVTGGPISRITAFTPYDPRHHTLEPLRRTISAQAGIDDTNLEQRDDVHAPASSLSDIFATSLPGAITLGSRDPVLSAICFKHSGTEYQIIPACFPESQAPAGITSGQWTVDQWGVEMPNTITVTRIALFDAARGIRRHLALE